MPIKATDKALKTYYATRAELEAAQARTEGNTRRAFGSLLAETAKTRQWALIEEQTRKSAGGVALRYDGELQHLESRLPYGYWEAKDSQDDLDREIAEKLKRGYAQTNIIFEDTRRAVLIQDGRRALEADLLNPQHLADLLNTFYSYEEPNFAGYEQASLDFKERIPELAGQLVGILADAHKNNPAFIGAYKQFFELCQASINPQISRAAVDEMLIQHLLTERLMRNVFENTDFAQRNAIAAEVENVVKALTSRSFSRADFFRPVERFYLSIEHAAKRLTDFSQKQTFINTVYERFFQGYSVKTADTHGIVYTPQPIVDFMCAAVEEVLASEFGLKLHDEGVVILDPCTGTGNFIVNLINRLPAQHLPRVYEKQLFANELMLLPYYIASLNIEHAYYERTGEYRPFEGLVFADTLDLAQEAAGQQIRMWRMNEVNTARVQRQIAAPITVIIGNPPYNVGQTNENDNNKNRSYDIIDERVRATYVKDSKATLRNKLFDPYVKFFRWATDRLGNSDGVVCYVTNNGFLEGIAFDGFRKHLLQDFTQVYHLDLGGNARKNQAGQSVGNVFNIMVGVGITVAIRSQAHQERRLFYHCVPNTWTRAEKLGFLTEHVELQGRQNSLNTIAWQTLQPDTRHTWLVPENVEEFEAYLPIGSKEGKAAKTKISETIFNLYSLGVVTSRDSLVYGFDSQLIEANAQVFIEIYNRAVDIMRRPGRNIDPISLIDTKNPRIKWTRQVKRSLEQKLYSEFSQKHIRISLYRPFTKKKLYFDDFWNEERYQQHRFFPTPASEAENRVIITSDIGYRARTFSCLMSNAIPDLHLCASVDAHQCFPFYVYEPDPTPNPSPNTGRGFVRRENITDWALARFRAHYGGVLIEKWDIFYYIYALLHHPTYRARFADNLKRELPRIPMIGGPAEFAALSAAGRALADLHLNYEAGPEFELIWTAKEGAQLDWRVQKMRLTPDKTGIIYNETFTAGGIPPEAFGYKLGNRSALEWVLDQYQVTEDKGSGIISDPNNPDDPEYIRRLIGQVIHVSLKTLEITAALPNF